jgi:transposase
MRRQSRIRKGPVAMTNTTYVGLDAHKDSIYVAMLQPGRKAPVEWRIANGTNAARKLARQLRRQAEGELHACYEAGPCGYALQRELESEQVRCDVIAPSLIPMKPGDRIKTDRRDAKKLAELLRAGLLTVVHAPTEEEESVRDLCRCREDAKHDQTRAKNRLMKFLFRHDMHFSEGGAWTQRYWKWLRSLRFENAVQQYVFEEYLLGVEQRQERVDAIEEKLAAVAVEEPYREPVAHLRCFRGIDTVTAMTVVAELHDIRRFKSPRELMAYLGLVPSEHTSSEKHRRGSITKAGNSHLRRVLVESSWAARHRPTVGASLRARRRGQSPRVIAIADRAMSRLHRRYWALTMRGKPHTVATIAITRELVGFLWAALTLETPRSVAAGG